MALTSEVSTHDSTDCRAITLEEHFTTVDIQKAVSALLPQTPSMKRLQAKLLDLGAGRLADMDAGMVKMQVLSCGGMGVDKLDADECTALMRSANDELASAVQKHPDRFAGFASINLKQPEQAARELDRCVSTYKFKGALVDGLNGGGFLDELKFTPIFEAAQSLGVPIYLHPSPPPGGVFDAYFKTLPRELGNRLATAAWGWHAELGLHALRLITTGVFDRYPRQQIIIGHMGENLPFSLERAASVLGDTVSHLERAVVDYFHQNFHVTSSGYFSQPPFQCARSIVGIDRLLYSIDYPYSEISDGRRFSEEAPLSPTDYGIFTRTNAENLLGVAAASDHVPSIL
jgi:predicted TIM-barrel fold metal-dependent hydrolase